MWPPHDPVDTETHVLVVSNTSSLSTRLSLSLSVSSFYYISSMIHAMTGKKNMSLKVSLVRFNSFRNIARWIDSNISLFTGIFLLNHSFTRTIDEWKKILWNSRKILSILIVSIILRFSSTNVRNKYSSFFLSIVKALDSRSSFLRLLLWNNFNSKDWRDRL